MDMAQAEGAIAKADAEKAREREVIMPSLPGGYSE